jgi:hypothetical protein
MQRYSPKEKSEGSTSFLKKRSEKLLSMGYAAALGLNHVSPWQKFFGSFFQKRIASLTIQHSESQ